MDDVAWIFLMSSWDNMSYSVKLLDMLFYMSTIH